MPSLEKDVYDNGHCRVSVELRPDGYAGSLFEGTYYPFAIVYVYARERKEDVWRKIIHPKGKFVTKRAGPFWLKKFTKILLTPTEHLEQTVIEAIRFADKYRLEYLNDTEEGGNALQNIEHVIEAREQLRLLDKEEGLDFSQSADTNKKELK